MAPRTQHPPAQDADDESLLVAAMANTESEIFTEAMGDDEDDNDGDNSLEQMEDPVGDDEEDAGEEEGDEEGQEEAGDEPREVREPPEAPPQERPAPSYRLPPVDPRDQAIAELRERLARMEGAQQAPQQQQVPPQARPDPVLDPDGYTSALENRFQQRLEAALVRSRFENNMNHMHAAYQRENRADEFQLAFSQLNELSNRGTTDPNAAATVRGIVNAPDPGHALMEWAEDNLDLNSFRQEAADRKEQQAEQLRLEAARLRGEDPGRPPEAQQRRGGQQDRAPAQRGRGTSPRLPSLNSAGGVGREGGNSRNLDPRGFDGSEESIFRDAFN
jgi:hypothetical protein